MADRVRLKATKSFPYRGRQLTPGDKFTARRRDARLLCALKRAKEDGAQGGTYTAPVFASAKKEARQGPRVHPLDRDRKDGPGGSLPHTPPAIRGKAKKFLLEVAKDEQVPGVTPEMSNREIIVAIEAKREAAGK